jgi:hypothetical protein
MSESESSTPIPDLELLARFVVRRHWIRQDGTIKQDAFIPPANLNLSATRHANLTSPQLWAIGDQIAGQLGDQPLLDRADVKVEDVQRTTLIVVAATLPGNPNHVHIVGWPTEKPAQKMLSVQLAAAARYVPRL